MCVLELLDCFIFYLSPYSSLSLSLFSPLVSFLPAFQSTFSSAQTRGGRRRGVSFRYALFIVVNYLVWYVFFFFFKFKENIVNRITRCNRDKVLLTMIRMYIDIFKRANFNWFKLLFRIFLHFCHRSKKILILNLRCWNSSFFPLFFFSSKVKKRYIFG